MVDLDYRQVFETFGDAVVAAGADDTILFVNGAAERLLGWSRDELIGKSLTVLQPERMRAAHVAGFQRFLRTGEARLIGRPVRVPALHRSGVEIDVELTIGAFRNEQGEARFVASLRDLRERVELEHRLDAARYMAAATRGAAKLTARLDLEHVLSTVVSTLVDDFGAALARVWLYDASANALLLRASAGLSSETVRSGRARIDVATYPYKVGVVARTRKKVVRNGLRGDPEFEQAWVEAQRIVAVAAHPLEIAGELRGVLVSFYREPVTPQIADVLETFAAMVASALNDVQLFQREQAANAAMRAAEVRRTFLAEASTLLASTLDHERTLQNMARLAVPHLAEWCVVDLVEDGRIERHAVAHVEPEKVALSWELHRRYPPPRDATQGVANVIRTARSELISVIPDELLAATITDPEQLRIVREIGLRSYMCVPLATRGEAFGAVTFINSTPRFFTPEDLATAEELARRASIALDNARLHQEAQRSIVARDEFLSIAAHELKTPLTSLKLQVQGAARGLRAEGDRGAAQLERMQRIERQVSRVGRLVDELLDISRITAGRLDLRLEQVDLVAVVADVLARASEDLSRAGCQVTRSGDASVVGRWDRLRLDQIVTNLVSNAIKYGGGKPIEVDVRTDGPRAVLSVRDHGIGISAEHQSRIFDRFERASNVRHYGGFGLGLWIVHRILEALSGEVTVESAPGEGSRFVVSLPLVTPPAT